eukprot:1134250-Pelagomonas_calceolata.AAC.14
MQVLTGCTLGLPWRVGRMACGGCSTQFGNTASVAHVMQADNCVAGRRGDQFRKHYLRQSSGLQATLDPLTQV